VDRVDLSATDTRAVLRNPGSDCLCEPTQVSITDACQINPDRPTIHTRRLGALGIASMLALRFEVKAMRGDSR
jgi:hypothetical protein